MIDPCDPRGLATGQLSIQRLPEPFVAWWWWWWRTVLWSEVVGFSLQLTAGSSLNDTVLELSPVSSRYVWKLTYFLSLLIGPPTATRANRNLKPLMCLIYSVNAGLHLFLGRLIVLSPCIRTADESRSALSVHFYFGSHQTGFHFFKHFFWAGCSRLWEVFTMCVVFSKELV